MVTNDQCFLFDHEPKPCMSSGVPCPELGGGPLAITRKTPRSNEIQNSDLRRVASAVTSLPTPKMADSPFLKALGTSTIQTSPGRKQESWPKGQLKTGNGTCAKTKLAILNKMQEGKTALIKKDGGEILIAIELDKPLSEAQALVDDPDAFMLELRRQFKINMPTLLSCRCSTLMYATTCPLQNVPLPHQKAKAVAL